MPRKSSWSRASSGPVPGPTTSANKVKEGREGKKGKKGRREEGKESSSGTDDGWIDGHRREQDIERREGGLGRRQNEKREVLIAHGEG